MEHVRHIWAKVSDLADDLGLPYTTVHSWKERGRIPASHDLAVVSAARRRGHCLTLEELAVARATMPPSGDAA